jgi:hypothetical protein
LNERQAKHLVEWLRNEAADRVDTPRAAGFHSLRAVDRSSSDHYL